MRRSREDWELIHDDYNVPEAAKVWFGLRTDLLFNLLKPPAEVIKQLDAHFLAFLFPYHCDCGQGLTRSGIRALRKNTF